MTLGERALAAGLLWLRVLTGAGVAYHGFGKIFGGRMDGFAKGVEAMGFPAPGAFAWAAALSESVGGVLLVAGLATRPAALLVFATMCVAVFMKHRSDPLAVKELALAYWTAAGALFLAGPGVFSVDKLLDFEGRRRRPKL